VAKTDALRFIHPTPRARFAKMIIGYLEKPRTSTSHCERIQQIQPVTFALILSKPVLSLPKGMNGTGFSRHPIRGRVLGTGQAAQYGEKLTPETLTEARLNAESLEKGIHTRIYQARCLAQALPRVAQCRHP